MATRVKQEPVSPRKDSSPPPSANAASTSESEQRILSLLQSNSKGISDKDIQNEVPDPQERAKIINSLLQKGCLELFNQGEKLVYKYKNPGGSSKIKGADNEEKIVYSIIEKAGNEGVWAKDLRNASGLVQTTLSKILKKLVNEKIIKTVKCVNAPRKVVYMLYGLEPDSSVTGGAWYNDQDFESEFVDVLNQYCYHFLRQKKEAVKNCKDGPIAAQNLASASSADVWKYISELGISKVKLSVQDMETILNTLVYDGKAERTVLADGNHMYRAIESLLPPPGIVQTPCGVCPVLKQCSDIGSINPKKCVYMTEWLE
ncbi:DNA-directed RNA polymerase III subunit RPC6 [Thrips palmi]|uniref:DNA-directed RNA polymerase III subunit RPC6 n=1 Tax=Thrips palmi TaxID=161013 RepID=A0A6P8Y172_THRPL|nr:DNA-directed RNA polymerase III subunit RPC6 [Thrips palmi]XP_034233233.1 DNA-directed RNA polymerase III subunit RPC6 [Thrips palmi]XP_034233234.1 DNA-directed RNA polymerase III subunit RPC6 [Thrips palmi]